MLAAVDHRKDKFQQSTGDTDLNLLHGHSRHVDIQVDDGHRLVQADLLQHTGVFFNAVQLEIQINIIGKAVMQRLDKVLHHPAVQRTLHIRITIIAIFTDNRIPAA